MFLMVLEKDSDGSGVGGLESLFFNIAAYTTQIAQAAI